MRISERYRQITEGVTAQCARLEPFSEEHGRAVRAVIGASEELSALVESVGEIPQISLEQKLSPVLLKAHSQLDRARVLLEDAGLESRAAELWELEQLVYRLLNDL